MKECQEELKAGTTREQYLLRMLDVKRDCVLDARRLKSFMLCSRALMFMIYACLVLRCAMDE